MECERAEKYVSGALTVRRLFYMKLMTVNGGAGGAKCGLGLNERLYRLIWGLMGE